MKEGKSRDHLAFERMVLFSDAVFAIAITLLVIEIKVPSIDQVSSNTGLAEALLRIIPQLIGFVVSFLLIGQTWIEHHRICLFIEGFDRGLLWWNLLLLLFVAFLPFTTAVLSEYYYLSYAVSLYAIAFAALGVAKALLWRHAVKRKLLGQYALSIEVVRIGRRVWATPLTSLGVVVLAVSGVPFAYFGFMFIPLVALILDRTASKKSISAA
jgi:uncharacterized membrane protein